MSIRAIAIGASTLLLALLVLPAMWPAAPWIATVAASSCNGASHEIALTAPNADPKSGTPTTTIQFTVTYADNAGCAPTSVVVVVPGVGQRTMTGTGTAWASGVVFQVSMRLPVGIWSYRFDARSGSRTKTVSGPGTIVIAVATPTPTPKPTPTPTPTPTPRPTPKPTPRPTAKPTPTPAPTAGPTSTPKPTKPPSPGSTPRPKPTPRPTDRPAGSSRAVTGPRSSGSPVAAGGAVGGAQSGDPSGDGTGTGLPARPFEPAAAAAIAIPLLLAAGFIVLLARRWRRRRANGGAVEDGEGIPESPGAVEEAPLVVSTQWATRHDPADADAGGLQGEAAAREPRRFADSPARGVERRVIAYRFVRLSSGPDELRSTELGRLDRRDEVEVMAEEGGALRVRTADGLEGWVPRVVLVGSPAAGRPAASESPEESPPVQRT